MMVGCRYVNPDLIARDTFGDWNSPEASKAAGIQAEQIRMECLARRESLAVETVFSHPDKITLVQLALRAGYFVRLFFICTNDPSINAQRVFGRRLEGGHEVPMGKIISRFAKSIAQCAAIIPRVDRAYVYDNSIENRKPALLFGLVRVKRSSKLEKSRLGPELFSRGLPRVKDDLPRSLKNLLHAFPVVR